MSATYLESAAIGRCVCRHNGGRRGSLLPIRRIRGRWPYCLLPCALSRIRTQEAVCPDSPQECLATYAVYLTPEQLSDPQQLTSVLAYAINIQTIPTLSPAELRAFRGGSTEPPPWPTGVPIPTPDATLRSLASRTVTPFALPYANLPPARTGPGPDAASRLLTPVVFSSAQLGSLTPTPTRTGTPTIFPTRTMVPSR